MHLMNTRYIVLGLIFLIYAFTPSNAYDTSSSNGTHVPIMEQDTGVTTIIYDGNIVSAYNAYISELKKNVTDLNKKLEQKDAQLGEYMQYKKENVELKNNISNINRQVYTLQAENKLLENKVEEYRKIFEGIATAQSEDSKLQMKKEYNSHTSWINRLSWAFISAITVLIGIVWYSNRADRNHRE